MDYTVDDLKEELQHAWTNNTTSDPQHWTCHNPAWGQCAVTACVVQDLFGGDIVWSEAALPDGSKLSHYFNEINLMAVDLTRDQFPKGTDIPFGVPKTKQFATTRDYILSFPVTQKRYETLKNNLGL